MKNNNINALLKISIICFAVVLLAGALVCVGLDIELNRSGLSLFGDNSEMSTVNNDGFTIIAAYIICAIFCIIPLALSVLSLVFTIVGVALEKSAYKKWKDIVGKISIALSAVFCAMTICVYVLSVIWSAEKLNDWSYNILIPVFVAVLVLVGLGFYVAVAVKGFKTKELPSVEEVAVAED